jgi:DNA topoisomerase-1
VARLLETTHIRAGNIEYAKTNHSHGLTTLRCKHVEISSGGVRFRFGGESGGWRIIRQCHDLPGQELFQYANEDGEVCHVDSEDVNRHLKEISGEDFTRIGADGAGFG